MFDCLSLSFVQPGEIVLHAFKLGYVPKQFVGVRKVFVDIVEVGQNNAAPIQKIIQRLTDWD